MLPWIPDYSFCIWNAPNESQTAQALNDAKTGFRPGRGPHQALDALTAGIQWKRVNWVLDADIRGFFDNMSHEWTMKFIEHRVADRRILRLIQKWLKAGVSEDGQWSETKLGTPQGAVASPLLANVYL